MVAMAEILALVLLTAALVWCVTRTNLFRHWHAHNSHPGQQGTRRAIADFRRDPNLERRGGDTG